MNKKTHEEYVKELQIKNPNVQVLEKYINSKTKIMHKCLIHNIDWKVVPSSVLNGAGCEKCHKEKILKAQTRTHEEYVEQLKKANPNIIPLEKFTTCKDSILHYCKKHNITWSAMPDNVLHGHGCCECGKEKIKNKNKRTYEEYQEMLKQKFPSILCSEDYNNFTTPATHKCLICEYEWSTAPINVLKGVGCPRCTHHLKRDEEYYINELKQINPQIELIGKFVNMTTHTLHKCKIHDYYWNVIPNTIVSGGGCPICGREKNTLNRTKTHKDFETELESISPDIICTGKYCNSHTKIQVQCSKCDNTWETLPSNLLKGSKCPSCNKSNGENIIFDWLSDNNINFVSQKRFKGCKDKRTLPFDFYIPSKKTAIEFDGMQHFKPIDWFGGSQGLEYVKKHDQIKTQYCKDNNIKLIRISYNDNIQEKLNSLFI